MNGDHMPTGPWWPAPTPRLGVRSVEVVQVVRVVSVQGVGTEADPVREVDEFWRMEGGLLVRLDPCESNGRER